MWNESLRRPTHFTVHHNDIKSSPLYGIGVGWQARHWLRFDLTGEYRGDALFVGSDISSAASGFGQPGTNEYTADIKSWLGLANAYIDMGNWCGFTPYIGAGIGFASITRRGPEGRQRTARQRSPSAPTTRSTNFAWALHAGVSYDVTPQTVIDLAYRYSRSRLGAERRGHTYDGATSRTAAATSRTSPPTICCFGVRYKLQREAVVYQPVK